MSAFTSDDILSYVRARRGQKAVERDPLEEMVSRRRQERGVDALSVAAYRKFIKSNGGDIDDLPDDRVRQMIVRDERGGVGTIEPIARREDTRSGLEAFGEGFLRAVRRDPAIGLTALGGQVASTLGFEETGEAMLRDAEAQRQAADYEAPILNGDYWVTPSKAGQAVGSAVSTGAALLNPALAWPSLLGMGGQAAGSKILDIRDRDERMGVETGDVGKLGIGLASGAIEVITEKLGLEVLGRLGSRMAQSAVGLAMRGERAAAVRLLSDAVFGAGVEGAEEAVAQALDNALSKTTYAPETPLTQGVGESFALGVIPGVVLTGAATGGAALAERGERRRVEAAVDARIAEMNRHRVEQEAQRADQADVEQVVREARAERAEEEAEIGVPQRQPDAEAQDDEPVVVEGGFKEAREELIKRGEEIASRTDPDSLLQALRVEIGMDEPAARALADEIQRRKQESANVLAQEPDAQGEEEAESDEGQGQQEELLTPPAKAEASEKDTAAGGVSVEDASTPSPADLPGVQDQPGFQTPPTAQGEVSKPDFVDTFPEPLPDAPFQPAAPKAAHEEWGRVIRELWSQANDSKSWDETKERVKKVIDGYAKFYGEDAARDFTALQWQRMREEEEKETLHPIAALKPQGFVPGIAVDVSKLPLGSLATIGQGPEAPEFEVVGRQGGVTLVRNTKTGVVTQERQGSGDRWTPVAPPTVAAEEKPDVGADEGRPGDAVRDGDAPTLEDRGPRKPGGARRPSSGVPAEGGAADGVPGRADGERGGRPGQVRAPAGQPDVEAPAAPAPVGDQGSGADAGPRAGDDAGGTGPGGVEQPVVVPASEDPRDLSGENFVIEDDADVAPAGAVARYNANVAAIKLLRRLEQEKRNATPEEKSVLASYTGWGWGPQFFDQYGRESQRAKDLRELLGDEEWQKARASTLNAHYTSLPVIRQIWKGVSRLGFRGGVALEPASGVGHFLGAVPATLRRRTRFVAVELDDITGRLARALYPKADVRVQGFQDANIPNNSVDLAISNVPFAAQGPIGATDYRGLALHDYFFMRSLDKVRPGGVVAFITSHYTLDKGSRAVREMMAERADFIGAIRLPRTAFKGNAGTEVTTDIIFLRKKTTAPFAGAQPFLALAEVAPGIRVNEYFAAHPEMVLGKHTLEGTMYGGDGKEYTLQPTGDLDQQLEAAIALLQENVLNPEGQAAQIKKQAEVPDVKLGSYFLDAEGNVVQGMGKEEPRKVELTPTQQKVAKDWIALRDSMKQVLALEEQTTEDTDSVRAARAHLNERYERWVKERGPLTRERPQHGFLKDDPEFQLPQGLENAVFDAEQNKSVVQKADVLTKRVRQKMVRPDTATDIGDAIDISMGWLNGVDAEYIASLLKVSVEEAERMIAESGRALRDPKSGLWTPMAKYLSGNVRRKLREAEAGGPDFAANVEALNGVLPKWVPIQDIGFRLGSRWIPPPAIELFLADNFGVTAKVRYASQISNYSIEDMRGEGGATERFATSQVDFEKMLDWALNGQAVRVVRRLPDGSSVPDPVGTRAAQDAVDALRQEFADWTLRTKATMYASETGEASRFNFPGAEKMAVPLALERVYNEYNNSYVPPTYDGSYLKLPGLSGVVRRNPHLIDGVARILNERQGVMAHVVGSGKTFLMAVSAMEMRRLGIARKPMIVVKNPTVSGVVKDFKRAYPGAKILAGSDGVDAQERRRFFARIATGDWDAVIVPQSQFSLVKSDPRVVKAYLQSQIDELEEIIRSEGKKKVKDIVRAQNALQDRLAALEGDLAARKDDVLYWESMGIDALFIDELQDFKRAMIVTRKRQVKGIPTQFSQRAFDLAMKLLSIHGPSGGKNVIGLTGTPVENTMAEVYIHLRTTAPEVLRDYHINNFDEFADTFGRMSSSLEYNAERDTYKRVERFNRFQNGPELTRMIAAAFDVRLDARKMGLKIPEVVGGDGGETIIVDATPENEKVNNFLMDVAHAYDQSGDKKELSWVPIVMMQTAAAGALDPRLVLPEAKDHPGSKVNRAVQEILSEHKKWEKERLTQLVFADRFNPRNIQSLRALVSTGNATLEIEEGPLVAEEGDAAPGSEPSRAHLAAGFNIYRDIKRKLIAGGIPEAEIAIIHDYDASELAGLFAAMNSGKIRVLLASTERGGVGINVQQKLVALHHLDPPSRMGPSPKEQRDGRMVRQGNENAGVRPVRKIHYGTKKTGDTTIYGMIEAKRKMIVQALSGLVTERTFEDPADEFSMTMGQMKAELTGDPRVLRRAVLENEIRDDEQRRAAFQRESFGARMSLESNLAALGAKQRRLATLGSVQKQLAALEDWDKVSFETESGGKGSGRKELIEAIDREFLRLEKDAAADSPFKTFGTKIPITGADGGTLTIRAMVSKVGAGDSFTLATGSASQGETGFERSYELWETRSDKNGTVVSASRSIGGGDGVLRSISYARETGIAKSIADETGGIARLEAANKELEGKASGRFPGEADLQAKKAELASIETALEAESKAKADRRSNGRRIDETLGPTDQGPHLMGPGAAHVEEFDGQERSLVTGRRIPTPPWRKREKSAVSEAPPDPINPEVKARLEAAENGLTAGSQREALRLWWENAKAALLRGALFHLPNTKRFSRARATLLRANHAFAIGQQQTLQALEHIVAGLDRNEMRLLSRKALLDDLAQTDGKLPFGYEDRTEVLLDRARIDAAIERSPKVRAALRARATIAEAWKADYVYWMGQAGVDVADKLSRKDYFHHQVLHFALLRQLASKYGGLPGRFVTPTNRGFLKARKGSTLDINANYLQVEFETLATMRSDMLIARAVAELKKDYDILPRLKRQAKEANRKAMIAATKDEKWDRRYRSRIHFSTMELAELCADNALSLEMVRKHGDVIEAMAEAWRQYQASLEAKSLGLTDDTDEPRFVGPDVPSQAYWKFMHDVADSGDTGSLQARTVFKAIDDRERLVKKTLGDQIKTWESLIPEGYAAYQMRPGRAMYAAHTIAENVAEEVLSERLEEAGISKEDLRKVLALGPEFTPAVVPEELAAQLADMAKAREPFWLSEALNDLMRGWKALRLRGPFTGLRAQLRNFSEIDKVLVFNPTAIKRIPRAFRDIWMLMRRKDQAPPEALAFRDEGGVGGLFETVEVMDIDSLPHFARRVSPENERGWVRAALRAPEKAWRFYWRGTQVAANYREAILRYALFLDYLEQMRESKGGKPRNFGASKPEHVMEQRSLATRAYILSSQIMGDYSDVSVAGQYLRRRLMPFWSFRELNFRAYAQGVRNIAASEPVAWKAGSKIAAASGVSAARLGVSATIKLGKVGILFYGVQALVYAINRLLWPDEWDDLPEDVKRRGVVLIFGRDADGKVRYFSGLGTASDVLSWFGIEGAPEDLRDLVSGAVTLRDVAVRMAKAPVNQVANALSPHIKTTAEAFFGKSVYPDAFRPRAVLNPWEHLWGALGLADEYRQVMGEQSRPYLERLRAVLYSSADPGSVAYSAIMDRKGRYLTDTLGLPRPTPADSERSDALRDFRRALRYGEAEAASKAIARYAALGGTDRGLETSLRNMHPLAGIPKKNMGAFIDSLTAEEQESLRRAEQYYHDILLGEKKGIDIGDVVRRGAEMHNAATP